MGLIAMSERDLQRIEVLSKVVERRMTIVAAAHVLALSPRQVRRLLERLQTDGAAALRHKARGRPSNNRINDGVRDYALSIVREPYADLGPTLAAEKLAEQHGWRASRETLRRWISEAGLWMTRKQRRTFPHSRFAPVMWDMKISCICSNPFRVAGSQVLSMASGSIALMLADIRSCNSRMRCSCMGLRSGSPRKARASSGVQSTFTVTFI